MESTAKAVGMTGPRELTQVDIAKLLPHAPPMLFVDKVIELEPGRRGKGIKNITADDPFLTGHFPGRPIMPGVLIVEACGQLAALVCATERLDGDAAAPQQEDDGKVEILAMIEHFKFLRRVVPGDQLILEATIGKRFQNMIRMNVSARVGNNLAAGGGLG